MPLSLQQHFLVLQQQALDTWLTVQSRSKSLHHRREESPHLQKQTALTPFQSTCLTQSSSIMGARP